MSKNPLIESCTVRPAGHADLDTMFAIEKATGFSQWSRMQLESAINELETFIIEYKQSVVGYTIYSVVKPEGELLNIAIAPDYKGKGLADFLIQDNLEYLKSRGITTVLLEVAKSNLPAKNLYDKQGFYTAGVRPNYYKRGGLEEDALIMRLELED